ncbi:putative NRPS, partial [Streptomyces zinciresistens K42]
RPAAPDGPPAAHPGVVVERRLRALWAEEFGVTADALASDASFFDLGGHSITAMRLVNRVREEFGTEYPMLGFYQEPTLRAMTDHLAGAVEEPPEQAGPGTVEHIAPATAQQARFATVHAAHRLPEVFNVALRITLGGDLDAAALRTALTTLVERHEGLRTRLARAGDGWEQHVLRPGPVPLPVEDLTALADRERAAALDRAAAEAAGTPLDPTGGPPMALRLLRTGPSTWVLLLVLHHSACDGWSVGLLLKELAALYGTAAAGVPHGLPPVGCQPAAYARWQREQADEAADERKVRFWLDRLDGVPFTVGLPLDRPRPDTPSGRGGTVLFTVPPELRAAVERLARVRGTTPFAVTAAALGRLLARACGRPDVVFNISYANRERRAFESLLACTVTGFALPVRDAAEGSFAALTDRVARTAAECMDHALPVRRIAPAMLERRGVVVPDRLDVGFAYQSSLEAEVALPGLTTAVEDLAPAAARAELTFGLVPAGGGLSGFAEYSADLWDRPTVEGWARDYVTLLRTEVTAALEG